MKSRTARLTIAPLFTILAACASAGDAVLDGDPASGGSSGSQANTPASAPAGTATSADPGGGPASGGPTPPPPNGAGPVTIFTVVFENHDYREIIGSPDAPFFNELVAKYGLATNYADCNIHPSLPNYLCMITGEPQVPADTDVEPTKAFKGGTFPLDKENLGTQLTAAKIPWRSYQESMATACGLADDGDYAPRHDPFLYFKDIQKDANGLCAQTNVPYSALAADMTKELNRYYFITPNLVDDGHDPSGDPRAALTVSDAWARREIGKIMDSPAYRRGRSVIFIVWDEAEGRAGNSEDQVAMIVVSEQIKSPGFKSQKPYSHRSYLATVEDLLGLPRLRAVKSEPTMSEFFAP